MQGGASDVVTTAYQKLSYSLFKLLEEVASSKAKYSEIVRLENYHFFHECITARARRIKSLAPMATQARLLHEKAAERCVFTRVLTHAEVRAHSAVSRAPPPPRATLLT